jgi:hypothetical protein
MNTAAQDSGLASRTLAEDIDDLRMKMAETVGREVSFTADPVILISKQLDVKIYEFMMQRHVRLRKAR